MTGIYIPIGAFITAYAREKTIRTSQAIKEYSLKKYGFDAYVYSDTDSIKCLLPPEELEQFCDIDDVRLGAWKNEGIADRGKFVRQKTYLEEFSFRKKYKFYGKISNVSKVRKNRKIKLESLQTKLEITCAGMPKGCYKHVNWNNFEVGFTCEGKLMFKHVKGGVKLVDTDFTIKEK